MLQINISNSKSKKEKEKIYVSSISYGKSS